MNVQTPVTGYETDFARWAAEQAARLRLRDSSIDWDNLAEEIEALGKSDQRELLSRLQVVIEHLLKLEHSLMRDPARGWQSTILRERQQLARLLKDSPSLLGTARLRFGDVHEDARRMALSSFDEFEPGQTGHYREALPTEPTYRLEDVLDTGFLPGA